MESTTRKRTTLADLIAAAELGAIDPATPVLTADDAAAETAELVQAAARAAAELAQTPEFAAAAATDRLPADHHDCALPGCRHGAAHDGPAQPDRQVKLACPTCGAVARMTPSALRRCGGITCAADGQTFAPAPRRQYVRRSA